jgi:lysozyme
MKTSTKATAAGGGALLLAVSFIQPWEGLWLTAKVDTIGTGKPVTACYGETEGVKLGEHFTEAQCTAMLKAKLPRYDAEISRCIHVPISDKERAAFISFAYNVGSGGFCGSSALGHLNRGDHIGACNGLMAWTHAQGRVVKGLVNRRTAERNLCLDGATQKPVLTFWQKFRLFFLSLFKGN